MGGCHPLYEMEIEESCSEDYKNESWGPPGIKNYAGKKGEIIFELTRKQVINQQKSRKKIKYENAAAEYHAW